MVSVVLFYVLYNEANCLNAVCEDMGNIAKKRLSFLNILYVGMIMKLPYWHGLKETSGL